MWADWLASRRLQVWGLPACRRSHKLRACLAHSDPRKSQLCRAPHSRTQPGSSSQINAPPTTGKAVISRFSKRRGSYAGRVIWGRLPDCTCPVVSHLSQRPPGSRRKGVEMLGQKQVTSHCTRVCPISQPFLVRRTLGDSLVSFFFSCLFIDRCAL